MTDTIHTGRGRRERVANAARLAFGLCLVLTAAPGARAQLPIPEVRYKYRPCFSLKMTIGQRVTVPGRCAGADRRSQIVIRLRGGVAAAGMRITGVGEFAVQEREKRLFVEAGTIVTLIGLTDLGGRGGLFLTVIDMSKGIPIEPLKGRRGGRGGVGR